MSSYKRGRKIKHRKKIYRKRKRNPALSVTVTVIVAAIVVFVGYSVGEPIVNYFRNNDNNSEVTEFEPEITTEQTQETQETIITEVPEDISSKSAVFYICEAMPDDMETLKGQIDIAKQSGANTFGVVLKQEGGSLHYKSEISSIQDSGIIVGTLTAKEIADEIVSNNMTPVAIIDVLNDNLIPRVILGTGYFIENKSTTWLDNSPSNGGKPWVSPFSEKTRQYISQITDEVVKAGFSDVIAKDITFPPFRSSDLNYIGSLVKDENRYTALISIMHIIRDTVESNGGKTSYLYVKGIEEVFVPSELENVKIIVEITKDIFEDEEVTDASAKKVIKQLKDLSLDNELLIRTNTADFTNEELEIISKTSTEYDINSNFKS